MIDLHTHILPGVDDGPKGFDGALAMLRIAEESGITALVASPHAIPGGYDKSQDQLKLIFDEFKKQAENQKIAVDLVLSRECYITLDLMERLRTGRVAPLGENGRYLLLELDFSHVAPWAEEVIRQLQIEDIVPIVAHPERNAEIIKNPNRMYDLVQMGCLGQLNAGSLTGAFGSKSQICAEKLVEHNLVHVMASDAHDAQGRAPDLRAGHERLVELAGEETARLFVEDRPRRILEGTDFLMDPPQRILEEESDSTGGFLAKIRRVARGR